MRNFILAIAATCLLFVNVANAAQSTTNTYGINRKGGLVQTQDAYLPDRTITHLQLNAPEDIFVTKEGLLYIADTGNKRVVVYNIARDNIEYEINFEGFQTPRGVFVTEAGDLYVADSTARAVFRFNKERQHIQTFERPNAAAFSDTAYAPYRVAVDGRGNLYIVGEGVYSGIMQLSSSGEFLGYFTTNTTTLTFTQLLQDIFFTETQKAGLLDRIPTTFSNVFVDTKGIVYTTTMGGYNNNFAVKKHNMAGKNMFSEIFATGSLTDITVDKNGNIFAADKDGYIMVYSADGNIIFIYGASGVDEDIIGLYSSLMSLAVADDGTLWALDMDKTYLQSYKPTEYTNATYRALELFNRGFYEDARVQWQDVLRYNQMSVLAHKGIGDALLSQQNYEKAQEHFEVAGVRGSYSQAFWEVRNAWLQSNLGGFLVISFTLFILSQILKFVDKKRVVKKAIRKKLKDISSLPVLKDVLYAKFMAFHPLDGYYYLKRRERGSVLGATILYVLLFASYLLYQTGKAYLFQLVDVEDMDMNAVVFGFFAITVLFVISNYLVTSINDGDGSIRDIFMAFSYASVPLMISLFSVTGLTYGLTFNETFLIDFIFMVGGSWSIIILFLGLQEIHNYTTRDTIKSIIITMAFMIIATVVILILTILFNQITQFIEAVGRELIANVMGTY